METNSKIISNYKLIQSKSPDLCLINPMILTCIIICVCLFLYIIGYISPNNQI